MTKHEANLILDQHKEGSHAYSMLTITKALFITGDLSREPYSFSEDGENSWMESAQLVEGETA